MSHTRSIQFGQIYCTMCDYYFPQKCLRHLHDDAIAVGLGNFQQRSARGRWASVTLCRHGGATLTSVSPHHVTVASTTYRLVYTSSSTAVRLLTSRRNTYVTSLCRIRFLTSVVGNFTISYSFMSTM